MLVILLIGLVLLPVSVAAQGWTPPANPDPTTILREASADTRAKRYENALAKHVWYHENALAIQPSQTGVRLSFALGDWHELGEVYPPAMAKLREVRDETETRIRDENRRDDYFKDFQDVTSLNRILDVQDQTVALFRWLGERNPSAAQKVFAVSKPALIAAGEYELCNTYLDPDRDATRIEDHYRRGLESSKKFGLTHLNFVNKTVVKDSATLVALLVLNDRREEADETTQRLNKLVDDPWVSKYLERALEAALKGTLPDQ